jgi:hypothetical protein
MSSFRQSGAMLETTAVRPSHDVIALRGSGHVLSEVRADMPTLTHARAISPPGASHCSSPPTHDTRTAPTPLRTHTTDLKLLERY